MKRMLNLGAGNRIIEDAVNHDLSKHRKEIDVEWDLNDLPWPWEDERFDKVLAIAVLEHLHIDLLTSIGEVWRILKPDGEFYVKLPRWNHEVSWNDLTHHHFVGAGALDQLDPTTPRGQEYWFYTPHKWKIVKRTKGTTSHHWTLRKRPMNWNGKN